MKILDTHWFCAGHGNVGIVRVKTDQGDIKYYIGQCSGLDSKEDERHIAAWGSSFPSDAGDLLFNR